MWKNGLTVGEDVNGKYDNWGKRDLVRENFLLYICSW